MDRPSSYRTAAFQEKEDQKMTRSFPPHRPARTWLRITLNVAPELTDVAAGFLVDLTGQGVETSSEWTVGQVTSPRPFKARKAKK